MRGKNVRVRSSDGGEFDCYRVAPRARAKVPAIVIASAVHGVNADVRAIADEFASRGAIAAAPDLFWRSIPGPLARDDDRTKQRSQPRLKNLELHVFPGVLHGYMMPDNEKAFHRETRAFSMERALAILEGLRAGKTSQRKAG